MNLSTQMIMASAAMKRVSERTIPDEDLDLVAKLFRGFADPTRLAILGALARGEQRVTDLVARIGGSQGNISGHLACLKECGMVSDRPEGRAVWYSISRPDVIAVLRAGEELIARTGRQVQICPNYGSPKRGARTGHRRAERTV